MSVFCKSEVVYGELSDSSGNLYIVMVVCMAWRWEMGVEITRNNGFQLIKNENAH